MAVKTYQVTDTGLHTSTRKPNFSRLFNLATDLHLPSEADIRRIHLETIKKEKAKLRKSPSTVKPD